MKPRDELDPPLFASPDNMRAADPNRVTTRKGVRDFPSAATTLGLLSLERATEVVAAARSEGLSPSQFALGKGLVSAADADIIDTLLGTNEGVPGYSIVDLLGRGGMGVVYHAIQVRLNRPVALKTILLSQLANPVSAQRFENEARILASVTHPNIVTAFDFGLHAGRLYLAMELVRGKDIDQLIRERGALPEYFVWHVIRQAAAGLAHAAGVGVVHRDIKPANLLLVKPPNGFPIPAGIPQVKIADFGLSILSEEDGPHSLERLTSDSVHVGSPAYMAPEMIESSEAGHAADIFALGITAWHMLVGRLPLAGQPLRQLVTKRLTQPTDPVSMHNTSVCSETNSLVVDMLQLDPGDRLHRYDRLLARIDRLLKTLGEPETVQTSAMDSTSFLDFTAETSEFTDGVFRDVATCEIESVPRETRASRPVGKVLLLTAGLLAAVISIFLIVRGFWPTKAVAPLLVAGSRNAIFDGRTLAGWQVLGGGWSAAFDDEGGAVIRGTNGTIASELFNSNSSGVVQHYAVEAVVRSEGAEEIEIAFEFERQTNSAQNLAVRFRGQTLQLGRQSPTDDRFVVLESTQLEALNKPFTVGLERQVDQWWLLINGRKILSTPLLYRRAAPRLQFSVKSGTASFSDLTIAVLAIEA